MNLKRFVARALGECASLAGSAQPKPGHRVLMYHAVGTPVEGDPRGLFCISPQLFEAHARFIRERFGNHLVRFEDGQNRADPAFRLSVTFDDGYADNLAVAAPVLEKFGIPFTVFVTTGFVASKRAGFLDVAAVKRLAAHPLAGLGAHGRTHVPLADCDPQSLAAELADSKRELEDWTGKSVATMAYPHGSANRRVRDAAMKAGYALAATSHFGVNDVRRDPLLLRRTEITGLDGVRVLGQKILGHWDWYARRQKDPADLA